MVSLDAGSISGCALTYMSFFIPRKSEVRDYNLLCNAMESEVLSLVREPIAHEAIEGKCPHVR